MARMVRTDIYLTPAHRDKLFAEAKKLKTGLAPLFRRMIEAYFGIESAPVPPPLVFKAGRASKQSK